MASDAAGYKDPNFYSSSTVGEEGRQTSRRELLSNFDCSSTSFTGEKEASFLGSGFGSFA